LITRRFNQIYDIDILSTDKINATCRIGIIDTIYYRKLPHHPSESQLTIQDISYAKWK